MLTSKPFHRHYNAWDSRNIPELNIQLCWVGVWVCVLHACVLMKTERLLRVTCDVARDQPDWKRPFVWSMLKLCYWHATDKKNSSRKSCLKIPLDEIIGAQLACPHPKTTCDKLTIVTCEWELHNAKFAFVFSTFDQSQKSTLNITCVFVFGCNWKAPFIQQHTDVYWGLDLAGEGTPCLFRAQNGHRLALMPSPAVRWFKPVKLLSTHASKLTIKPPGLISKETNNDLK